MRVDLLDKPKKKKTIELLNENYGINELPYLFIKSGDKIRMFSGNLSWDELNMLAKTINIDLVGTRLGTISNSFDDLRLSFDIMNLPIIKEQIKRNILELNDDQMKKWMKGENIEINTNLAPKFISLKNKEDFIGIARNHKNYIQNYVPKERRIRK